MRYPEELKWSDLPAKDRSRLEKLIKPWTSAGYRELIHRPLHPNQAAHWTSV